MEGLQSESRDQVLRPLFANSGFFEHVCSTEAKYPLKSWHDYVREDTKDEVTLTYWPIRENYSGHAPETAVVLKKVNGEYGVVSYHPAY